LAALRLPEDLLETLAHLGLAGVGDVLALPREQLRSRFGPLLLDRINQFIGAAPEVILAVDPPEEFVVGEALEHPLSQGEAIRIVVERLLERLCWLLAARRAGALGVACRIECEGTPAATFQFGLFRATACARHLREIAELQLERVRLGGPAAAIEVRAQRHATLVERQGALFDESRSLDGSRQLAALVDRFAGRLGRESVAGVKLVRDAQPELAYREESLVGSEARSSGMQGGRTMQSKRASKKTRARRGKNQDKDKSVAGRESEHAGGVLERPLCLLARPAAVEMASVVPEGPPIYFRHRGRRYDVARHWGPERIETGWWRRERAVRDYYRVETSEGRRFWLFRRRDGRWFLQGNF
jgi:protein ImuB